MGRQKQADKNRSLRIINSPGEITSVIQEELASPRFGPLPELAVLTSSSALMHQLRSTSGGLSGVTFLSPFEVASLILLASGEYAGSPADPYLSSLIEALISSPALESKLCYFKLDQLRMGAGYAEALAATISELSNAAFTPSDLRKTATSEVATASRLKDIAAIWEILDSHASSNDCTTYSQILNRASALLSKNPSLYPFRGRTVVFFDEQTTNTMLHFLATVPRLTAVYFRAFPERRKLKARLDYAVSILKPDEQPPDSPSASIPLPAPLREINISLPLHQQAFRSPHFPHSLKRPQARTAPFTSRNTPESKKSFNPQSSGFHDKSSSTKSHSSGSLSCFP